jgi:hypothetical protein
VSSSRRGSESTRPAGARKPESKGAVRVRKAAAPSDRLRARPAVQSVAARPRPRATCRLSDVLLEENEVVNDAFDATLDGLKVRITAVLERTCVYVDRAGDRRLASKKDIWVKAGELPIRRRSTG